MTLLNTSEQTTKQPDDLTTGEHMDYILSEVKKVNSILSGLKEEYPKMKISLSSNEQTPIAVHIDLDEV